MMFLNKELPFMSGGLTIEIEQQNISIQLLQYKIQYKQKKNIILKTQDTSK